MPILLLMDCCVMGETMALLKKDICVCFEHLFLVVVIMTIMMLVFQFVFVL